MWLAGILGVVVVLVSIAATMAEETVRQRMVREDRQPYGNIASVERLNETLRHWAPPLPFEAATQWDSLSLNTDVLRPVEAAQQVIAHYRLPTVLHNLTTQWSGQPTGAT